MNITQFTLNRKYLLILLIIILNGGIVIYAVLSNSTDDLPQSRDKIQAETIEIYFKQNRENFIKTRAQVSKDDGSNFYYTFYRETNVIQAIREVWDGADQNPPEVRYHFFDRGKLVLVTRIKGEQERLSELIDGSDEHTTVQDKLFFDGLEMTDWIGPDGLSTASSDPRWTELEEFTIRSVNYYLTGLEEIDL